MTCSQLCQVLAKVGCSRLVNIGLILPIAGRFNTRNLDEDAEGVDPRVVPFLLRWSGTAVSLVLRDQYPAFSQKSAEREVSVRSGDPMAFTAIWPPRRVRGQNEVRDEVVLASGGPGADYGYCFEPVDRGENCKNESAKKSRKLREEAT